MEPRHNTYSASSFCKRTASTWTTVCAFLTVS
uniref:Uncharacterized protein n=1 Tax=Rhizophora mucronata TaxID=61149 RepID=A0A2P2KT85_RHIMU